MEAGQDRFCIYTCFLCSRKSVYFVLEIWRYVSAGVLILQENMVK